MTPQGSLGMLSRKKKFFRAGIPEGRRPGFALIATDAHEPRGTNGDAEVVTSHPQTAKTKQPT